MPSFFEFENSTGSVVLNKQTKTLCTKINYKHSLILGLEMPGVSSKLTMGSLDTRIFSITLRVTPGFAPTLRII